MPQVLFMYKCLNLCVVEYLFILKGLEDPLVCRVVLLRKYHNEYFVSFVGIAPYSIFNGRYKVLYAWMLSVRGGMYSNRVE